MSGNAVVERLDRIRTRDGEEAYVLAKTIVNTFAGVGRGISGKRVVMKLADEVERKTIRMRGQTFIYENNKSTWTLGALGDEVLDDIVSIATAVHANSRKKQIDADAYDIREGILAATRKVSWEIESRERWHKVRAWVTSLFPFHQV